jgi:hypothetical protein
MDDDARVRAFTATSLESFEAAAIDALGQIPGGPEGTKSARVVEQEISEGGFVGRPQYRVTVVTRASASDE